MHAPLLAPGPPAPNDEPIIFAAVCAGGRLFHAPLVTCRVGRVATRNGAGDGMHTRGLLGAGRPPKGTDSVLQGTSSPPQGISTKHTHAAGSMRTPLAGRAVCQTCVKGCRDLYPGRWHRRGGGATDRVVHNHRRRLLCYRARRASKLQASYGCTPQQQTTPANHSSKALQQTMRSAK